MPKYRFLVIPFIFIFLFGCSSDISKNNLNELIIYPSPPETPRLQYLTKFTSASDVEGKRSGLMEYVAGESGDQEIIKPYGMIIVNGKIIICDTILGGLVILDLESEEFRIFQPKGLGVLKTPINIEVDNIGRYYVADAERREIVVFDSSLSYLDSFGSEHTQKPTDVVFYDNRLWVANSNNHSIDIYSADTYEYLNSIPDYTSEEEGFLNLPTNLFIQDDVLYVSDFGAFSVKTYNLKGNFIKQIGSYGREIGQFARPKGITVSNDGVLYAVDAGFENVQMFDKDGKLLMFFGGPYNGPGDMWLPANVIVDYDNTKYFEKYVNNAFNLKYLVLVSNQYGPDKINVYGFIEKK